MATSKQLHHLATHPAELMHFRRTGKLPSGTRPESPLITLIECIGARDAAAIRGVTVDERLGYAGRRQFATLTQAYLWVRPSAEVFGSFPADSWRIKNFHRELTLDDLLPCCASVPQGFAERHRDLHAVAPRKSPRA